MLLTTKFLEIYTPYAMMLILHLANIFLGNSNNAFLFVLKERIIILSRKL